jgi:hypothetical protein
MPLHRFESSSEKGLLGYATFPWQYDQDPVNDGVVLLYSTVPNGETTGYNEGKVGVHSSTISRILTRPEI